MGWCGQHTCASVLPNFTRVPVMDCEGLWKASNLSAMGTTMLILHKEGVFFGVVTSCLMPRSCLMEWSHECTKSCLFVTHHHNGVVWAKRLCVSFAQIHEGVIDGFLKKELGWHVLAVNFCFDAQKTCFIKDSFQCNSVMALSTAMGTPCPSWVWRGCFW